MNQCNEKDKISFGILKESYKKLTQPYGKTGILEGFNKFKNPSMYFIKINNKTLLTPKETNNSNFKRSLYHIIGASIFLIGPLLAFIEIIKEKKETTNNPNTY